MTRPGRAFYDRAAKVLHVYDDRALLCHAGHGSRINMAQLLNPIFFERDVRHPNMKRQRGRRLRDRALQQARELKTRFQEEVPPNLVLKGGRLVYLAGIERWVEESEYVGRYDWRHIW